MTKKRIKMIGAILVVAVWAALAVFAWLKPADARSDAERRALAQIPALSGDSVLSKTFMKDFESYSTDQFPMRETFRRIKALFHYKALGQKDNNGIYIHTIPRWDSFAAQIQYPLNEAGITKATDRFNFIYETYLSESEGHIYSAIIPDKGYYIAEQEGYPSMDYNRLFELVETRMPWAKQIDLTQSLILEDYYHTDTHWRQEKLMPTAETVCRGMGLSLPDKAAFTPKVLTDSFYGVYYGQAALPMDPDTLAVMETETIKGCVTYGLELDQKTQEVTSRKLYDGVYDLSKIESKDPYDVYLSGPQGALRIENPNAKTDKELILFRDSYGSSFAPWLLEDYASVTLVDLRYVPSEMLEKFVDFHGQDVLFLYSTLILNSGSALK